MKKKILYGLVLVLIVMQFIRPDREVQIHPEGMAFHEVFELPTDLENNLKAACYDCHSNQTNYPWYSYVAPVSWLVAKDTREGRDELNFSTWGDLSKRKKIRTLNDIAEEVEEKEMPLEIYTVIHRDAKLSSEQIEAITAWTKSSVDKIMNPPSEE